MCMWLKDKVGNCYVHVVEVGKIQNKYPIRG